MVGLGNPGDRYRRNRHNAGFVMLDLIAGRHGIRIDRERHFSLTGEGVIAGRRVVLAKPLTFMNLSGGAVRRLLDYNGLGLEDLVVLHDDLDMVPGKLRVKSGGGHGGHNGLRSIIAALGSGDFVRLKMGIGRPPAGIAPEVWVLRDFTPEERPAIEESMEQAADMFPGILAEIESGAMERPPEETEKESERDGPVP